MSVNAIYSFMVLLSLTTFTSPICYKLDFCLSYQNLLLIRPLQWDSSTYDISCYISTYDVFIGLYHIELLIYHKLSVYVFM